MSSVKQVKVGSILIGGGAPITVQTMWDRPIREVDDSLIKTMESYHKKGCDLVRFALPSLNDVDIISQLIPKVSMPLVGDIHFDYKIALKAIEAGFHKIRINPGNIGEEWKIREVIKAASDHGTAIRIGANEGSLSAEQKQRARDGSVEERSRVLVEAAEANLEVFEQSGFSNIVISLKSSDIHVTYHSNKLFRERHDYPLHLGITEAGPLIPAIVKSTLGLADLLKEGIGETVRISISDNPEYEILAANELLGNLELRKGRIKIISCPKCGRSSFDTHAFLDSVKEELYTLPVDVTVAIMGCTVNGPGEASHADLGITGYGKQIQIFRHGKVIRREDPCTAKEAFLEELVRLQQG
ncbi:MAG: 4-hydroxy-3-methylbut-2-en-1-yl diphosphate synthase [Spirochaetaceae bacterium 4572_59]|nr:MAG: 4-hydroxy-3-methylbut-2-en-1-yl diphosphate synthase [Spirochaetaceae bacterium 4572_59]